MRERHYVNDMAVQVRPKNEIKERPRVYHTIAKAYGTGTSEFDLSTLFEQHDLVDGNEVELQLGIVE